MSYQPSQTILNEYAKVLVNFALNSGKGVKRGEVVQIAIPDIAKPLALELRNEVLEAGAHPMLRLLPTGFGKDFYELANKSQLTFFPGDYIQERVKLIDHSIGIIADPFPFELKDIDPKKIVLARDSQKAYRDWLNAKENKGKFTWTVALWGVEAKAKEVGLSMEEYWQQIIKACYLDKKDPIAEWRKTASLQAKIIKKLDDLEIDSIHIKGNDADLHVGIGADRVWMGGSGRNIPSFEIFTSPDWRRVNGWISFNQPVYRYGNVLSGVQLEFKKGLVVKATAKKGQKLLDSMLKSKNADKAGEISLTDTRMSRITHVMAETLFDENIGGPFGNTHLAIGMAYKDCFRGDQSKLSKKEWDKRGFNDSAEHTDIVSTTDRDVTATLQDGSQLRIYSKGRFVL